MISKAIDISKHQPRFDAATAKAAGIGTVICRAAYGTSKDIKFDAHAKAARDAGLNLGSYQFATWHYDSVSGGSEAGALAAAMAQADFYISLLRTADHNSFAALDLELESGCRCSLGKEALTRLANAYMDRLAAAGYTPLLYASASWIQSRLAADQIKYPWWVAYYYAQPGDFSTVPSAFPATSYGRWMQSNANRIAMWQFSSAGYADKYGLPGSSGLDKNWCYTEMNRAGTPAQGGNDMKFLQVTSGRCEVFSTGDVNEVDKSYNGGKLVEGAFYPIQAETGSDGQFDWVRIYVEGALRYAVVLPDRSKIVSLSPGDAIQACAAQAPKAQADTTKWEKEVAALKADKENLKQKLAASESERKQYAVKIQAAQSALA